MSEQTRSTSEEKATPKNRGLIARDLTLACYAAWKPGSNFYNDGGGYTLDRHPDVKKAENAVCDRIGELEEQVKLQAKIIQKMREAAHELQLQVAGAIKIVGTLPKPEEIF